MSSATIEHQGNGQFLLKGVLSFFTVPALRQQGLEQFAAYAKIVVHLGAVSYSDSSGLALLSEWLRFARNHCKSIEFQAMPAQMQAIAKVTGLTAILS